jgi:hypothetical protein
VIANTKSKSGHVTIWLRESRERYTAQPSCSRAGTIGPGVTGCFSIASSSSADVRIRACLQSLCGDLAVANRLTGDPK